MDKSSSKKTIKKALISKADELYQLDTDRAFVVYEMIQDLIKDLDDLDDETIRDLLESIEKTLCMVEDLKLPRFKEY